LRKYANVEEKVKTLKLNKENYIIVDEEKPLEEQNVGLVSAPTKQSKIMEAKIRAMNMPFSRRRPGSHAVNTKKRRTGYLPGEHHNINPSTSAINEEYDARERDMRKAQQVSTFNTWIKSSVRREQQRQNMEDFMDQEMIKAEVKKIIND